MLHDIPEFFQLIIYGATGILNILEYLSQFMWDINTETV